MRIAIVDRGRKIPAENYGGTERVIWGLGYELTKLGHDITYIVPKGSTCPFAEVIEYSPSVALDSLIPKNVDFVHMNFAPAMQLSSPFLLTVHGNNFEKDDLPLNSVFISKNHAQRFNSNVFVHNGLLWDDYPEVDLDLKREYFHFLGKRHRGN